MRRFHAHPHSIGLPEPARTSHGGRRPVNLAGYSDLGRAHFWHRFRDETFQVRSGLNCFMARAIPALS